MTSEAKREVFCADAIPWMAERGRIAGACAVTSLPDVSEVGVALDVWHAWFLGAVRLVVDAVPDESAALWEACVAAQSRATAGASDGSSVDIATVFRVIRGSLPPRRAATVHAAFSRVSGGTGAVSLDRFAAAFTAAKHPDVVAKLRSPGSDEHQAAQHCDEVLPHARMDTLLRQVDTVHVMTSLAGFEALLRGRRLRMAAPV